jgi:hypothetical protein
MYTLRYYLRLGWHIRLLNLNVIGFTVAIFGVVQIGIIFSSLVVILISQSLFHQEQNHQPKLDWLFSCIYISLSYCVSCSINQVSVTSKILLVLASPPL